MSRPLHHAEITEPSTLSVIGKALKDGVILALAGAAVSAVAAGIASAIPSIGSEAVLGFLSKAFGSFQVGGGGITAALATSATLGAAGGAILGLPIGAASGASAIKHYYRDIELPKAEKAGEARGMQIEAEATQYENAATRLRESIKLRDPIDSRGENHVNAQAADALKVTELRR